MTPVVAYVARNLVGFGDVTVIAAGGTARDLYGNSWKRRHRDDTWAYRTDARAMTVEESPAGPGRVTWAQLAEVIAAGLTPELRARVARVSATDRARAGKPFRLGRRRLPHVGGPVDVMVERRAVVLDVVNTGLAAVGVCEQASFEGLDGVA